MAVPFINFVHPDDVDASVDARDADGRPRQPDGRRVREPLPHARRGLPLAAVDGGRRSGLQALRGQGRDRPPGGRGRARRGRPADPPLRGPAPHADRQPARHHRVPARSRPPDPGRRRRGDQPPRRGSARTGSAAAWWPSCTPRSPTAVLELSLTATAPRWQGERRAFEFVSEGLTFAVQAVPVRADDGSVESVLVVARDTTERTHAEEQIARRARQQNAVAELGRFALESHDLGELMTEAVTTATATLGVGAGQVLELGEDGESLTVVAAVGLPDADERRGQPEDPDRGSRPAVRGSHDQRRRTARVLRGRGRVPHRRRDADHAGRRAAPRGAGVARRRAARPAHRPAEPHAGARPARLRARPPAPRADRRRGVRARPRRLQDDQRLARPRRRRRGAAGARAAADRGGAHDRHGRAPGRRRVRRHLPGRRRRARRARRRRAPRGRGHRPAGPRQRRALLHRQHRRHAGGHRARTRPSRCCATPTRRCTGPRRAAADATSCSTTRCGSAS